MNKRPAILVVCCFYIEVDIAEPARGLRDVTEARVRSQGRLNLTLTASCDVIDDFGHLHFELNRAAHQP